MVSSIRRESISETILAICGSRRCVELTALDDRLRGLLVELCGDDVSCQPIAEEQTLVIKQRTKHKIIGATDLSRVDCISAPRFLSFRAEGNSINCEWPDQPR